jgi:hypothetical protein
MKGAQQVPFPQTTPYDSAHPPPSKPRWATALKFVIPSVAEGPAVRLSLKQLPTTLSIHPHLCKVSNRPPLCHPESL